MPFPPRARPGQAVLAVSARFALALLLASLIGCGTASRLVRLDTGQDKPLVHTPHSGQEPVALRRGELQQALSEQARKVRPFSQPLVEARWLLQVSSRSQPYAHVRRQLGLVSVGSPADVPRLRLLPEVSPADAELKRLYLLWCGRAWGPGDCLRLLVDSPMLAGDGKYALAMAIAQGSVLEEMKDAFGHMVDPQAVLTTVASTMTVYLVLMSLPEPVSKGVAGLMTIAAVAYLGVDTLWRLIDGWRVLMAEVDRATTFEQLRAAGEKYGKVMGQKAAQAFVLLATVAVGNTAQGMAAKLPTLPGAAQAAVNAEARLGIRYAALAEVDSVALSAEGLTLVLAPQAVAMTARGTGGDSTGTRSGPLQGPGEWVKVNESMPEHSRRYQVQVTGTPEGQTYRVKANGEEADFDGFKDGFLLEAKGTGYAKFIDDAMDPKEFFKGASKLVEQAERQLRVAGGTPIRWIVAEEKFAAALRKLFASREIDIEVIHISVAPYP